MKFETPKMTISTFSVENIVTTSGESQPTFKDKNDAVAAEISVEKVNNKATFRYTL